MVEDVRETVLGGEPGGQETPANRRLSNDTETYHNVARTFRFRGGVAELPPKGGDISICEKFVQATNF